ncbi:MAG: YjjG family noncanonical pyrimidine nucleotidase [Clostridia bacterium]|nr:YjjG family noncanonical pyrimidine nucleotidase [Clostridia bacterium]
MMKYEFILLDADDTLFDFSKGEAVAFHETLKEYGITPLPGMVERYSAINDACWKRLERGELTKKELIVVRFALFLEQYRLQGDPQRINELYIQHLSRQAILIPGALEFVKNLYGKAKLYIITNGTTVVQQSRFARTELTEYIEKIFISEQMGTKKPDILFFEKTADAIEGFTKQKAVVIGDSLSSDMKGAENYGLDRVWFNPRKLENDSGILINCIASCYEEIEQFLEG